MVHQATLEPGAAPAWELKVQTCCQSLRVRLGACDIVPVVVGLAGAIASCTSRHSDEDRLGSVFLEYLMIGDEGVRRRVLEMLRV